MHKRILIQALQLAFLLVPWLTQAGVDRIEGIIQVNNEDYEVIRPLGAGGFGEVFTIKKISTGEMYALKLYTYRENNVDSDRNPIDEKQHMQLRISMLRSNSQLRSGTEESKNLRYAPIPVQVGLNPERLQTPAELSVLKNTPNKDWGLLMPLAQKDLKVAAQAVRATPENRVKLAIQVFHDIIPELALLAKDKLSHGDIKPQNILSSPDQHFGLADFDDLVPFGSKHSYLSTSFSAPESIEIKDGQTQLLPAHPASDLYSLSLSLTEVLFPKLDNEKRNSAIINRNPDNENLLREELRQADPNLVTPYDSLIRFIKACLSQNPHQRVINLQSLLNEKNYFALFAQDLIGILAEATSKLDSAKFKPSTKVSPTVNPINSSQDDRTVQIKSRPQKIQCLQILSTLGN